MAHKSARRYARREEALFRQKRKRIIFLNETISTLGLHQTIERRLRNLNIQVVGKLVQYSEDWLRKNNAFSTSIVTKLAEGGLRLMQ